MPDIVVAKVSDIPAASQPQPCIVRRGLMSGILRQIMPADAGIAKGLNDRFGVVGTAVADHEDLEILFRLPKDTMDGQAEHAAPVVGRDDYRYQRLGRRPF